MGNCMPTDRDGETHPYTNRHDHKGTVVDISERSKDARVTCIYSLRL